MLRLRVSDSAKKPYLFAGVGRKPETLNLGV